MSSLFFAIFRFRPSNRSVVRGLVPKIDKIGCPDFGPRIGHFRGGLGSAGPIFANFRHFSATNIGGYLLITRERFLIFCHFLTTCRFADGKRARAHRGRIATRNGRKKRTKMGPKRLTVRPVSCSGKWAQTPHPFRDWQFRAFGAGKAEAYPEA